MGLSSEDKVYILVGRDRDTCGTFAEFSSEELRQCKVEMLCPGVHYRIATTL